MKTLMTVASALFAAVATAASAAPEFYFTTGFAYLSGVSNEGTAVGSLNTEFGVWNPGQSLQAGIGGVGGSGYAGISNDGRYIGGTAVGGDGRSEMARYDRNASAWTTLGGTGGYSGSTRSTGYGISRDGSTVVGFGYGTYTGTGTGTFTGIHPGVWREGQGLVDYAFNPTATSVNRIQAASNTGAVAGIARYPLSTSVSVGVVWSSGVGSQEGMAYNSGLLGEASVISSNGQFVGGHGSVITRDAATPPASRPYVYDTVNDTVTLIESIAGQNGNDAVTGIGSIDGLMTGMTGDGGTAIGFFRGRNTFNTPLIDKVWGFIWTADGGVMNFDAFAASLGAPGTDDYYYVPTAISGDGSVIAGYRYLRTGLPTPEQFMFTNIPAPGATTMFAMIGGVALRRRRA